MAHEDQVQAEPAAPNRTARADLTPPAVSPGAVAARGGAVAVVSYLQRTAGNRAAARWVADAGAGNRAIGTVLRRSRARSSGRILARYEPGEHVQFETGGRTIPLAGMSGIDERYLIAMADFYRDPDALINAKMDELKELMALIDRDERARTGGGGKSPSENEWQAWSEKWRPEGQRYMDLNKVNEAHFSPRNKARWEELHKQALKEAQSSGNGSGVVSTRARVLNGFAAHFLTDAFSAGHLIDKIDVMARAKRSLRAGTNRDDLAAAVARGIVGDAGASGKLRGKEIKDTAVPLLGSWGPPTQPRLASLLSSIMDHKEAEFLSVFARVVHDNLNEAISSGYGVWVANKVGDRWQLSGDTTLKLSSLTLDIARKAVNASEDNLRAAAAIKSPGLLVPGPVVKAR
jgi:hypothetical protein